MKKVTITFVVPETTLIKGAEYELENGNIEYAIGMLEADSISTNYTIKETKTNQEWEEEV